MKIIYSFEACKKLTGMAALVTDPSTENDYYNLACYECLRGIYFFKQRDFWSGFINCTPVRKETTDSNVSVEVISAKSTEELCTILKNTNYGIAEEMTEISKSLQNGRFLNAKEIYHKLFELMTKVCDSIKVVPNGKKYLFDADADYELANYSYSKRVFSMTLIAVIRAVHYYISYIYITKIATKVSEFENVDEQSPNSLSFKVFAVYPTLSQYHTWIDSLGSYLVSSDIFITGKDALEAVNNLEQFRRSLIELNLITPEIHRRNPESSITKEF